MLERTHLKLLLALSESGSLTAAAENLHLTQSALSHSIKKLEHYLGLALWEKRGRQIQLTEAGEYLLKCAQTLEPHFLNAEQTLQSFAIGKKGRLRLGMECHPCYEWLMTIMPDYLKHWPGVDLDVTQAFRLDGMAALDQHKIDVLITSDPLNREDLLNIPVLDYELMLVAKTAAHLPRFIKPKALANQKLFTFPVEKSRLDIFSLFLLPEGVEPKEHIHIETIEVMLQLVASGRGVCTLPHWLLEKYQQTYALQGIKLGKDGVKKQLHLVVRKADIKRDYFDAFIQLAQSAQRSGANF